MNMNMLSRFERYILAQILGPSGLTILYSVRYFQALNAFFSKHLRDRDCILFYFDVFYLESFILFYFILFFTQNVVSSS